MNRIMIENAISSIDDRWIAEAIEYKKNIIKRDYKKMIISIVAAIIVLTAVGMAIASTILPNGLSINDLYPFSDYSKWHDNYSYKTVISQQAVVKKDIVLKDNYTFEYSSKSISGDQEYQDLEWKNSGKCRLKKGDIVDVLYYGDQYSTVCLSIKGKYHVLIDRKESIQYGILNSKDLSFDDADIEMGNQAQLNASETKTADADGRFLMLLYDEPDGNAEKKFFTKDVEILQRKDGWAKIESIVEDGVIGWCQEDKLTIPAPGWNIYNPSRCIEDDKMGDSNSVSKLFDQYLKQGLFSNEIIVSFETMPNAFVSELSKREIPEQEIIIKEMIKNLSNKQVQNDRKIISLIQASALDHSNQATAKMIASYLSD